MAVAPAPTRAGVFGTARTTAAPPPSQSSRRSMATPVTIETSRSAPTSATCRHAASASSGLTASTVPSAATGAASTTTPGCRSTSAERTPGSFSLTASSDASAHSVASSPPSRASPIRPPPTITRRGLDIGRRLRHRSAGPARNGPEEPHDNSRTSPNESRRSAPRASPTHASTRLSQRLRSWLLTAPRAAEAAGVADRHRRREALLGVRVGRPHDVVQRGVAHLADGGLPDEVHRVLRTEREACADEAGIAAQQVLVAGLDVLLGSGHHLGLVVQAAFAQGEPDGDDGFLLSPHAGVPPASLRIVVHGHEHSVSLQLALGPVADAGGDVVQLPSRRRACSHLQAVHQLTVGEVGVEAA